MERRWQYAGDYTLNIDPHWYHYDAQFIGECGLIDRQIKMNKIATAHKKVGMRLEAMIEYNNNFWQCMEDDVAPSEQVLQLIAVVPYELIILIGKFHSLLRRKIRFRTNLETLMQRHLEMIKDPVEKHEGLDRSPNVINTEKYRMVWGVYIFEMVKFINPTLMKRKILRNHYMSIGSCYRRNVTVDEETKWIRYRDFNEL